MTPAQRAGIEARDAAILLDPAYVAPTDAVDTGPIRGYDRRALLVALREAETERNGLIVAIDPLMQTLDREVVTA